MHLLNSNCWVECLSPRPEAKYRLLCFPYVGGAASLYRLWPSLLSPDIELHAIELPGRGRRFGENFFSSLLELILEFQKSCESLLGKPFAVFGHSMGALLAFEWVRILRKNQMQTPFVLFLSAFGAPHLTPKPNKNLHLLPDSELLLELKRLQGTPLEVLEHQELMQLLLPMIRADLKMLETYRYGPEFPLDIPFRILGGKQDAEVEEFRLSAWKDLTTASFKQKYFEGDHFFVQSVRQEVLSFISEEIESSFCENKPIF